jgi:hypothetical protein
METATRHVLERGYFAFFGATFSERLGLPMLVRPFMAAMWVLVGHGAISLALVVLVTSVPAVAANVR